jgi:hypothetical protein
MNLLDQQHHAVRSRACVQALEVSSASCSRFDRRLDRRRFGRQFWSNRPGGATLQNFCPGG